MPRLKYKLSKINIKIKKWLECNKIYFETLVMVSLTVAGIIVSCVSVSLSKTANVLSKESNNTELIELELQKNKMLPILGYAESRSNGELGGL